MQIHRLFEIVFLLLKRKTMTAGELAEHFDVSKRTILRDIDILSSSGIPVYTIQGKGGGISIMENYVLSRSILTDGEQEKILLALQGLNAAPQIGTDKLLQKLEGLFNKADTNWIEVDFSRWGQGPADNKKFDILKSAILNQMGITFDYISSSGERNGRNVYPLKLVFKSKAWYLQAFCTCRQDYRTFKINRMLKITNTDERFDQLYYNPPPIEDTNTPSDSLVLVELVFAPHVMYRVYDEFDDGAIERGDNDYFRVTAKVPEDNWLYSFLLSFGKDVSVVSPENVKLHLEKLRN